MPSPRIEDGPFVSQSPVSLLLLICSFTLSMEGFWRKVFAEGREGDAHLWSERRHTGICAILISLGLHGLKGYDGGEVPAILCSGEGADRGISMLRRPSWPLVSAPPISSPFTKTADSTTNSCVTYLSQPTSRTRPCSHLVCRARRADHQFPRGRPVRLLLIRGQS